MILRDLKAYREVMMKSFGQAEMQMLMTSRILLMMGLEAIWGIV